MYGRNLFTLLAGLVLLCNHAFAQPPNDDCNNAISLGCAQTSGTNNGATVNSGFDDSYNVADICAASLENTVWYEYTATATGNVNVNFTNINCASGFGIQLGVFTGPCGGPYTPVGACVNGNPPPPLNFPAVNGQSYFIVLDGDAGDNCTWDVNVCPPGCAADAGTMTTLQNGAPATSPVALCVNDCFDFSSNLDYVLPPAGGSGADPELMILIYNCPPTTGDPATDPCYSGLMWTGESFSDCNNAGSILVGAGFGPQVWLVPVAADDGDNNGNANGAIHWDQDGDGCFDLGTPLEVTFLNPITFNATEDCSNGEVDITISGGFPEFYGGNYTVTNTGAGTVTGTPVSHGGTITITGLNDGDSYSISITDANGCTATFSGGPFAGPGDPTITAAGPFCESDPAVNLTAVDGGGTWTGPGMTGNSFNPATAGPGTHTITYSLTLPCPVQATTVITVNPDQDATITPVGPYCISDPAVVLTAVDGGGAWTGPGMTGNSFDPATAGVGTHTITYTIANPCGDQQTTTITVNPDQDATITPVGPFCESDPAVVLTAVDGGGAWTGPGMTGNSFDPATAGPGTHTITYTIANPCGDQQTTTITVNPDQDATITPVGPYCISDPAVVLTAVDGGGAWTGPGMTGNSFDPATAGVGTHTITYTIANPCGDQQTTTITVNPNQDATITPVGPYCESDPAVVLTAVDGGGTWTGPGMTGNSFDPATAGPGTHTITYTIANPCGDQQTTTITVNPDQDATITPVGPFCESDPAVVLTAVDGGGTWTGPGMTGNSFDPATASVGTHTITYTIANPCGDQQTTTITVDPDQDATITPAGPFCLGDPSSILTAVDAGGVWTGPGMTGNSFDPATAGVGVHTITYTLANPCGDQQTTTITVNTNFDATITPSGPYCANDPAVVLTAVDGGGTWTGPGMTGNSFDPATAGVGTHTITYTIAGSCGDQQTTTITVDPNQDATITPVGPYCESDPAVVLTAVDGGGAWTGPGMTGNSFDPATAGPGVHTITYTIANPCGDQQTTTITVNPDQDATITPSGPYCESDPSVNLVGADPNGTWSGTGITDPVNGTFDPATAGVGVHTVTYTIANPCGDQQTTTITVNPNQDATITPAGPFCLGDAAVNLVGADPNGTWSGTGITDPVNGTFDPATAGVGVHTVTYTIANPCGDQQTIQIAVNSNFDATITPVGPYCESDPSVNLTAVDIGGSWTGTGITDAVNGTFDPATAGVGTHTVTYTIPGSCGDQQTTTIDVLQDMDATITPPAAFCPGDPALNLTAADPGGTWSGTGITDPVNGTFDPAVAGVGVHTITYTIAGQCGDQQTVQITINAQLDATITPVGPYCESDPSVNLTAVDGGGTWTGTGITDAVNGTFDPATAGVGTHTVTYTIAGSCGDQQTTNIDVLQDMDATITPPAAFCPGDPALNLTAADPGGTWSGTGITDPVNGTFDPAVAGVGVHTVTYTIAGQCGDQQTVQITINAQLDATITPVGPYCESDPSVNLTAVDLGGSWTGTGITDAVNGTFDPVTAGVGTHTITYTILGSCGDQQTTTIDVLQDMDATITPPAAFCPGDPAVNLTAADPGGTWSGTGITDPVNGTFDPVVAGVGVHTVTYTIAGQCGDQQTVQITINAQLDATITPVGPYCESDPSVNLTAVDGGGTWTGTGITDAVNGTFDPATAGVGTHTITYTIVGSCGDQQTTTIDILPDMDATITQVGPYCTSDPAVNLTAVDPGGTWSGTGITDPVNGTFDPAIAGVGTHTVTYTILGQCGDQQTINIDVSNQLDATITPAGPFCESNIAAILTAVDAGGTWSGTGITDPIVGTFDPTTAGPGTHIITYTLGGSCGDQQTVAIDVIADDDATITPAGPFCTTDPISTVVAVDPNGTWTATCGACIDAVTGDFDPAAAGVGNHDVTYTISGACGDQDVITIVVNQQMDATITGVGPYCVSDPAVVLVAVDPGGLWAGAGIIDVNGGLFDPATAGVGSHTITYTIAGSCGDQQTTIIDVLPDADATINPAGPYCLGNPTVNLTAVEPGGTWSGTGITDAVNGTFDPAIAGVGIHTVTYTIAGQCGDQQTAQITITPNDDPTITPVGPYCESDLPTILAAATPGGTWTGNGITNANTGAFDPGTAGPGIHTITYTITGPCGAVGTTDIEVFPTPVIDFIVDKASGCLPLTVTFTDNTLPVGVTCSWDFGDNSTSSNCGSVTHTFNSVGCFDITLTITTADGCSNTMTIPDMICVYDLPIADFTFGPQPTSVVNPTINFNNTSTGATTYNWDFAGLGTSTDVDPSFTFPNGTPGIYDVCLVAISAQGCTDTTCQIIEIGDEFLIYVPNTFTPDGDGINDMFIPIISGADPLDYELLIFNRWGEQIFQSSFPQVGWDGTYKGVMSQQDVYVWKVIARDATNNAKKEFIGHVTLLK
jgi:gliding motility-associated-like protein